MEIKYYTTEKDYLALLNKAGMCCFLLESAKRSLSLHWGTATMSF